MSTLDHGRLQQTLAARPPTSYALPFRRTRAVVVVSAAAGAYWFSFASLWGHLIADTPLAFVALAPPIAGALLLRILVTDRRLPRLPGREDLLLGSVLLAIAAYVGFIGPAATGATFWDSRLDLVAMLAFTAGCITLLFGWRALYPSSSVFLLLLLAWPVPIQWLVDVTTAPLTAVTAGAVGTVMQILPFAQPAAGEGLFLISGPDGPFVVQVASACAGLNSVVAIIVVGTAFLSQVVGSRRAKASWLVCAVVLAWTMNVIRVSGLMAAGASFGENVAIDLLHPVAGLAVLTTVSVIMVVLLPRFRLGVSRPPASTQPQDTPLRFRESRRLLFNTAVVLGVTVAIAMNSLSYRDLASTSPDRFAMSAQASLVRADLLGWTSANVKSIDWARRFFGAGSTWDRYTLRPGETVAAGDRFTVWVDVVSTPEEGRLDLYSIEACYGFHAFELGPVEHVALGNGIVGSLVANVRDSGETWLTLWWEWSTGSGDAKREERVVLLVSSSASPSLPPSDMAVARTLGADAVQTPQLRALATAMGQLASTLVARSTGAG